MISPSQTARFGTAVCHDYTGFAGDTLGPRRMPEPATIAFGFRNPTDSAHTKLSLPKRISLKNALGAGG